MNVSLPGGLSGLGTDLTSRLVACLRLGQDTRLIQIDTPLPAGSLVVERLRLDEGVHEHEPLWAEVDCLSTNAHLELKALIGGSATLRLKLADGQWRQWHGYIVQAGNLGSDGGAGAYRLRLAAFTHWLQQRRDTRIFQGATPSDIVSAVLSAYPQARFRLEVASPGPVRDITTQYRETDWAFVKRILAREGWSWYLEHDEASSKSGVASHTLVIFDASATHPQLGTLRFGRPDLREAGDSPGLSNALAHVFDLKRNWATDKITAWHTGRTLGANAVTQAAWDPRQLQGIGSASSLDVSAGQIPLLEHYAGHGRPQAYPAADTHLAAIQLTQQWVTGQSAVRRLGPAAVFLFDERARIDLSPDATSPAFCVLTVTHEVANNLGTQAAQILRRTDVDSGSYRNHFRACPATMRIAPPPPDRPTVSGLQTAQVMGSGNSPVHTDRDLRIRVQFAWQRGHTPLPGALTAPTAPSGQDTGHAPGDAQSGTWVRVAHSVAGPNWGTHFTPRAGTEVLVDFVDGDIDHPIVVGQLHNGAHDVPWPAGEDSGANHAGAISGWHHDHLDGQGSNQWLLDDTAGQLRMRLVSQGVLSGHSELALGHIIQQSARGGSGQAQRGPWLGEGFYGHTEGWAIVRASEGLLLTSCARLAQGASVDSTQMDAREAVTRLHASQSLGRTLSQSALQQGALGLRSQDNDQAVSQHANAIDPSAQGQYIGHVNGHVPKKAEDRTLNEPVERFHRPLLHLDAAASAIWVTPSSLSMFSGEHTSLTLGGDAHLSSAHTLSSVSGQTTSLYTHAGGIKAITANGSLSLRAHTDAEQIWSDQDLTIQSTTNEVRIQASNSITLTAGQSQIVIKGGDITFTCPGTWTVKGATHAWEGSGSGHALLTALPSGGVCIEPSTMVIERLYHDAEPMAGTPYEAVLSDGSTRKGVLNGSGTAEITGIPLGAVADVRFGQMPGAYEPKDQRPMPAHNPAPRAADIDALLDKYSGGLA